MSGAGLVIVAVLGFAAAAVGVAGGIGGSVLLVPALVLLGYAPAEAAPLGLMAVGAGSLAASSRLLASGLPHRPLGVVVESSAAVGAALGAALATHVPEGMVIVTLALVALTAAAASGLRRGTRNKPDPTFGAADIGEAPRGLTGAYDSGQGVVPYHVQHPVAGLGLMGVVGVLAGLTGTSGGYLKTPIMSEIMRVPVKVAAATTSLIVGLTAASALLVFLVQGRVDLDLAPAVVAGSFAGGVLGVRAQGRLPPVLTRRLLSALLVAVAVALLTREVLP